MPDKIIRRDCHGRCQECPHATVPENHAIQAVDNTTGEVYTKPHPCHMLDGPRCAGHARSLKLLDEGKAVLNGDLLRVHSSKEELK